MNPSVPFAPKEKKPLVLCPVALAIGCEKCPLFKPCPFKTIFWAIRKKESISRKNFKSVVIGLTRKLQERCISEHSLFCFCLVVLFMGTT